LTRQEKNQRVEYLTEEFKSANGIVVADYKGLSVPQIEALRISAKEQNVKVKVVKNTLANISLKNANIEGIELKDTNIVVWGEDQLNVCKVAAKFAKEEEAKFILKTATLEGELTDVDTIVALSKMPSRDELIGMLLSTWMAPVTNFTIGLDALRKQKEEESA